MIRECECDRPMGSPGCLKCGKPRATRSDAPPTPSAATMPKIPHGPHSLTPQQVRANQEERMLTAMTLLLSEGADPRYVSVAAVIKRAGCSRRAFYEIFGTSASFRERFVPKPGQFVPARGGPA